MSAHKHRVVVVGSGVGAVHVTSLLSKDAAYETTIVSPKHLFEMHGSLYRDRKGRSRRHIAIPLSTIFSHKHDDVDLVKATVVRVDSRRGRIFTQSGVDYPFDSLVLALPAVARLITGVDARDVFSAYDIDRLSNLRRALVVAFENGDINGQNITILGGGETGVELAAEVALLTDKLAEQYGVNRTSYKIVLLEQAARLMFGTDKHIGNMVQKRLKELDVLVSFKKKLLAIEKAYSLSLMARA